MTAQSKSNLTKHYLALHPVDIIHNEITFQAEGKLPIQVPFFYDLATSGAQKKLKNKVFLTEDDALLYMQMVYELTVSHDLINAIMTQYVLNDEAEDYRNSNIFSLNTTKATNMFLKEFVTSPEHNNIFFVIGYNLEDSSLICVKVDPVKSYAYGLAIFNLHQVSKTQWNGPHLAIKELENLIIDEDSTEIDKLIMSIPEVDSLIKY